MPKPAPKLPPRLGTSNRNFLGYTISKGIPAPRTDSRLGRRFLGKWGEIFANLQTDESISVRSRSDMVALNSHARRSGFYTVSRTEPDGNIRVWKLSADTLQT